MSLAALVASASLLVSPVSGQYSAAAVQHQKPPIYAQASEVKDEGLEKRLALYGDLIFKPKVGKNALRMALEFYNDIIMENKNSSYLAEAYHNSGLILAMMIDQKDVGEGLRRLDEAYKFGDKNKKIWVLHTKFTLARDYEGMSEKDPNLKSPEYYAREMEKLDPYSQLTRDSKKELKRFRQFQKPK